MSSKKAKTKKTKEKIKKAKQILENNSKNTGILEVNELSLENNKEELEIALDNDFNNNDSNNDNNFQDKEIQGIKYSDLQTSFEKGFLYLKTLKRCQESVLPYKIYLMENTLYQVKHLDLEDEAFYIVGEGSLYIKILFDDKDFAIKAEGI